MQREVKKLENSKVEVTVTFTTEEWKAACDKAFDKIAKNVQIDGFRKGKAPANLVKAKVDQGRVYNEAIDSLLPKAYETVLKEEKLQPWARPAVDVSKMSETELEVKIMIVTAPEVTLGKYKGLHFEKKAIEVTDHEIEHEIEHMQEDHAELVVKEGAAELGDTVVLDFEGFIDNVAFEGGKAENYSLELGSHSFVPGFEEQLVGLKAEDKKDIVVTFPKEYVEHLAGKDATFKITVHEVKAKRVLDLGADLIAELNLPDVATVEQLKEHVRKDITAHKEDDAKKEYFEGILKLIREDSKIEVADEIIHDEVEAMKENLAKQVEEKGLTLEKYLQITGQSEEAYEEKLKADALVNIKSVLIMEKIATVEDIKVTPEQIDFEIAKIADQYKMEFEKVKEILSKNMDRFTADIRSRYISDFLLRNND